MTETVQSFLEILDLEPLERDLFRGRSPQNSWQRVFGGQVIGQALVAASRTCPERSAHSLHAYFLRPGDPKVPIIYQVERLRDGKSFSTRRVIGIQHGAAIFAMSVSFHEAEPGFEHALPMPNVPRPEDLPSVTDVAKTLIDHAPDVVRKYFSGEMPIEMRPVTLNRYLNEGPHAPEQAVWFKPTAYLPPSPMIHTCVLAYASDLTLLDASLIAHNKSIFEPSIQAASLDHAMWFHNTIAFDDWHLYVQDSPRATGARGFARGLIYNRHGDLVASVAQEGLIRPHREMKK